MAALARIDQNERSKIFSGYALDPHAQTTKPKYPNVVVVAADHKGEIVRYYETGRCAYFGARRPQRSTGRYEPENDPRMVASTGKVIAQ